MTRVRLGPADHVTLVRAALVVVVAGLLLAGRATAAVPVAVVALLLDLVDGQVARRTGTASASGARFDMETDALLILVLSVHVAAAYGAWVLLIGAARYLLWGAEVVWPWLRRTVPPRYWRKVVAAIQGVVLTVVTAGVLPAPVATATLVGALVLLTESFGRDVVWLRRTRPGTGRGTRPSATPVRRPPAAAPAASATARSGRGPSGPG
jgi:phosphatidylglycerophosphate synthase